MKENWNNSSVKPATGSGLDAEELNILHLEDREEDVELIQRAFVAHDIRAQFTVARGKSEFLSALDRGGFDLVLADGGLPGFDGMKALHVVREKYPGIPFIAVSGSVSETKANDALQAGATNYILKDHLWQLIAAVRTEKEKQRVQRINSSMSRLVAVVQQLSLVRNLEGIMAIVRHAARELTGADGATFVLRDNDCCFYADEEAIAPLWKGQRFPLQACISGWAMLNKQPAVIKDIYADSRIPADAYRPTFVKSLAMVPIRTNAPIGAIGNYWAKQRMPTKEEIELLQALANTTAVAMENVQVYGELEKRVKDRTAELEAANKELETFSYAVSHDLGAPLRSIRSFTEIVLRKHSATLDETGKGHLEKVRSSGEQMSNLIDDLLRLSKFTQAPLKRTKVNLTAIGRGILNRLAAAAPERAVQTRVGEAMEAEGDSGLLNATLENLLSNAWKYTSKRMDAQIEFGSQVLDGSVVYFVRDNGAGFEMEYATRLFKPFQRLHSVDDFPGTGVGLATVQRIIQRHGGKIWAEAEVDKGATFFFTLNASRD